MPSWIAQINTLLERLGSAVPGLRRGWEKRVAIRQHDLTDCGAACLASVAAYYEQPFPIARIRQMAGTDRKGTSMLGLVEAAQTLGFSAKAVKAEQEHLSELPYPLIAHVEQGTLHHYVVVYGFDTAKGVQVMDPAKGYLEWQKPADFSREWTGILLLLAPQENFRPQQGEAPPSVLQRFWQLLLPHKPMLMQVLAGALAYTLLGLATSIYLQKIIDFVLPDGNRNLLNLLSLVMVALLFVQLFINYVRTLFTLRTGQQIDARLILGYYRHLLTLPQSFFDGMRTGELISRMNDAVKIRLFINEVLVALAVNVFIVLFSFGLMFSSYWKLAAVMLTVVPLYGIVYWISNQINKRTQRKLMEDAANLQTQLVESVNAVGTIKRFGVEDFANLKTETRFVQLLGTSYRSSVNGLQVSTATSFLSSLFVIVLLWVGAGFVLDRQMSAGELLSFYAITGYFTGPVVSLINMNKTLQDALIAADRLFNIMDLQQEQDKGKLIPDAQADIVFKEVVFRYGTRAPVFNGLNLHIEAGKVTAIIGESGSGKTTLLSLLQNIYPLQSGKIMMGETDISYASTTALRKMVGVVPQQLDLFAGTVVENIALGEFDPDMERVLRICRQLGMIDFIEQLPNGFATQLGENATNLSGGQRQRLAIARALYKNPQVLILDEATSALDSISEASIQHGIDELRQEGKTIIIIAHRLSTIMNADKIIALQNGQLVEEGSHSQLLKADGYYASLWKQQQPATTPRRRKKTEDATISAENTPAG